MTAKKEQNKNLQTRPPVVVVLGHVDHGKSSILEKIKDLKITEKESGGITQHIGAYEVEHQGKKITFVDTPGHEAFSAMRSRGAKVADIAILVVAAEAGVKPQTKEAIEHIKKAGIPMIIAINKMDMPGADSEKVKRELSVQDISVESMGGKIPSVETSAETGKGIPDLLELILLVAEMEDFKADISKLAEGVIVESYLDSQRGPTATLILQNGILKRGDILGTSSAVGKIRTMEDFQGKAIEKAFPSVPVVVLGFENVPGVGEKLKVFANIEAAKEGLEEIVKKVASTTVEASLAPSERVLNIILKLDVLGSLEAIEEVLKELPQEKVALKVLKAEVGEINESDVKLAIGAKAKIIGFRIKADSIAQRLAEREKIKIICFDVIYELAQGVRDLLGKRVSSEIVRNDLGKVKILEIFLTEKNRQIIGGKVIDGEAKRGASVEVYRNEEKVGQGKITKLQKEKKEIGEVGKGAECGILYNGDVEVEQGDILHVYIKETKKGEL